MATHGIGTDGANAGAGTQEWAHWLHRKFLDILLREEGQFLSFTEYWDEFVIHKGWVLLRDKESKPFPSYKTYVRYDRPFGLGMSDEQYKVHEEAGKARDTSLFDMVQELPELNDHGGDRKTDGGKSTLHSNVEDRGNSNEYWIRRLKRDAPDIAQALGRGELPSVYAARKEAGLLRIETPLCLLKRAWGKASKNERAAFLAFIDQEGQHAA